MKEKLIRFMQGRYGVDQFTRFLMGVALACMIISLFTRNAVWSFLILLVLVYSYFRMFSKNIQKRYAENQKYLQMTAGIRKKMGILPEGYEGQKNPSHLQMPWLQTENQGSEGKRENRNPLPEVSNRIYQEELTGEKYVRVRNC